MFLCRSEEEEADAQPVSTVRPEEVPPVPENRFLMRRSPQKVKEEEQEKEPPKEDSGRERQRERERERDRWVEINLSTHMDGRLYIFLVIIFFSS